jgi:molecular chaperone GrpE
MKKHFKDKASETPAPDAAPQAPAEEAAALPSPEPSPATAQALADATAEIAALKDRLLRLQADFENFRKRTARERQDVAARTAEALMTDLLPALDHFELGLHNAAAQETSRAIHDGFQMVYDQLLGALRKYGLTPIDAASAAFDPHVHEAVAHVPSAEYAADEIVEQVRRGYRLGEKLLRPVHVVVSSGPGAPRDDEPRETPGAAPES